jgi:hypothetical protein
VDKRFHIKKKTIETRHSTVVDDEKGKREGRNDF